MSDDPCRKSFLLASDIQHLTSSVMKLAAESQTHIQNFFRCYLQDQALELPPILIYGSRFSRLVTGVCRMGAITFGRRIFIMPAFIERNDAGRLTIPGWLVAHEAMHVLQYKQSGAARFLVSYLYGFWRALRESGRWNKRARISAYLAIAEECAARKAEDAYCEWRLREERSMKAE